MPKDGLSMKIWQRKHESLSNDLIRIEATLQNIDMEDFIQFFMNPPPDQQSMMQEQVTLA